MQQVQIYRGDLPLFAIKPEDDSSQLKKIMGENELRINFVHNQFIDFKIGDKAQVYDEWYYLNRLPEVTKVSSREFQYTMLLQSTNSVLQRLQYLFLGSDNSLKEGDFSLTGKAVDFINLIIQNAQRLYPGFDFKPGQIIDTDYKTLTFSADTCFSALSKIAQAFDTEYWIEGMTISLTKMRRDTGYQFKLGQKKGLYEIIRQTVDNQNVVTRLYAFGSDKNLPENYRSGSKRLKLPSSARKTVTNVYWTIVDNGDGTNTYTFHWDPPEIVDAVAVAIYKHPVGSSETLSGFLYGSVAGPQSGVLPYGDYEFVFRTFDSSGQIIEGYYNSPPVLISNAVTQPVLKFAGEIIYIEKNVDRYGLSEATIIYDDIFPHRTGKVTGVNAGDEYEFTDAGIDFNVNDYTLPGMTAKVTFNSGQLSGYTFELSSFDNATKKFRFVKNKNERSIDIPNPLLRPAIGDEYVLIDIKMPQSYIDAAEAELKARAEAELDVIAEPQMAYKLTFDPVFIKTKGYKLQLGDLIWIVDSDFGVNRQFRIVSVQRGVVNETDYSVEVADTLREPRIAAIETGQGVLTSSVRLLNSDLQNAAILNNRVIGDLIITEQGAIKFDNLPSGTGLTAVGIGADGRLYKM